MKLFLYIFLISLFIFTSCKGDGSKRTPASKHIIHKNLEYAKYFSIEKQEGYKKIVLTNPWNDKAFYATYYLVPKDVPVSKEIPHDANLIRTPIGRMAVLSSPHIGLLTKLDARNNIVAIGESRYVFDEQLKQKASNHHIKELGSVYTLDVETLIALQPDVLFATASKIQHDNLKQLQNFGISVVYNIDWMEQTPLARAEWIKFMACFTNQEAIADSIFNAIKNSYLNVANKALKTKHKPNVLVGQEWKGVWNTPGGNSYFAQFLKDAGASYPWSSDTSTGSLALSFEEIFDRQSNADIWLNPGQFKRVQELLEQDKRLQHVKAVSDKEVYGYFNKINSEGANAYWETGGVNPDLILSDLIKILHPEVLPNYELYYYKKLE